MTTKSENNYAFIDGQNLHLGIIEHGWKLSYRRFRTYLAEKYGVSKAYFFIGYLPENQRLYKSLQEYGYVLIFKPILKTKDGKVKGNVDADLVLQTMVDFNEYHQAVIVTGDGDFHSLVAYLYGKVKLRGVLCPNRNRCSVLLTKAAKEKIFYLDELKKKLAYNEKAPPKDRTQSSASSS